MAEEHSTTSAVQLRGISKRFGKLEAVRKMNLKVPEGSLVTLLGPSGCGKTTILRMIAGLETPTSGTIYIKGKEVNRIPIHKRNLGMIFQDYALFPHKNVYDNVAFGLKYRDISKSDVRYKVKRALEMVRLPGVEHRMPLQLSGGQQQRIALARAIVIEPDVLLMDEPLSALDENLREEMRREIDNLQEMIGVTTIFVTHDQREALSMSDKIAVINKGVIQQHGDPEEVYNHPSNHFVADFLGHSNFLEGIVSSRKREWIDVHLNSDTHILTEQSRYAIIGKKVEVVVRAQKIEVERKIGGIPNREINHYEGKIVARSYMGGEIRYVAEIENGIHLNVISTTLQEPLKIHDSVVLNIHPQSCSLLPKNTTSSSVIS